MKNKLFAEVCDEFGARRLANSLVDYWHNRGWLKFRVEVVKVSARINDIYAVRSNLGPTGFPPR